MVSEPATPDFLVDPQDRAGLQQWLIAQGFLQPDEALNHVEKAGQGNMNLALRLRTSRRSLILKQSRAWVEKYPSIAAPAHRAQVEAAFYRAVATQGPLTEAMPQVLGVSASANILLLEDLGASADFSDVYEGGSMSEHDHVALVSWLSELHRLKVPEPDPLLHNEQMRVLNHEHIFDLPLKKQDGLHADQFMPGLEAQAVLLREDESYVARVAELGALYLSARSGQLSHGDFYPGSWLRPAEPSQRAVTVAIIDPEFCFIGPAEFDVGVMWAHAIFAGAEAEAARRALERLYRGPEGFDMNLAGQFAGVELMRRLIGVAQLPLQANLGQRTAWLQVSRQLVLGSP